MKEEMSRDENFQYLSWFNSRSTYSTTYINQRIHYYYHRKAKPPMVRGLYCRVFRVSCYDDAVQGRQPEFTLGSFLEVIQLLDSISHSTFGSSIHPVHIFYFAPLSLWYFFSFSLFPTLAFLLYTGYRNDLLASLTSSAVVSHIYQGLSLHFSLSFLFHSYYIVHSVCLQYEHSSWQFNHLCSYSAIKTLKKIKK